ncbi:MAG: peptide ABC transporter substrate-binding protein [Lachnospiraceae bacterium]|nr:peptide ABC transporter substrate-binding protein [Lachnospiraceae bacterium]
MKKMIKTLIVPVLILSMLFSVSCSKAGDQVGRGEGKEINVALMDLPTSMDAQKSLDARVRQYTQPFASAFFRLNKENEVLPDLARDYELSEDGRIYTIHLRDNLRYSNGDEIKARDFVFSFRRIVDPAEANPAAFLFTDTCRIKNATEITGGEADPEDLGVAAPDDKTVVVELEAPCPFFPYILAKNFLAPCNEDFFRECGKDYCTSPQTILASGPFMVDRYEILDSQIHYIKNPYYVDADRVVLSDMLYRQVSDYQQAEMLYQTGEMDVIRVGRDYLKLSMDDPCLRNVTGGVITYIIYNTKKSDALKNKNIRMALSKVINRDDIVDNYYIAGVESLTRVVPQNVCNDPDGRDFSWDVDRYDEICGFDKERALDYWKKGLEELAVSTVTIEFSINSSDADLGEIITRQLEKSLPGLNIELKTESQAAYIASRASGNYEMAVASWGADYPDPDSFLGIFRKTSAMNTGGYSNEGFDAIMDMASNEMDPAIRLEYLHKAEDIIMNDLPVMPLFSNGYSWLVSDRIENCETDFSGYFICPEFAGKR